MKLAIKIVMGVVALLLIGCGILFFMMYEPNRAVDRDIEINSDMDVKEVIGDIIGAIDIDDKSQITISEDLINYGIGEYLDREFFSEDNIYVNYSYINLDINKITFVTHVDVETDIATIPTIVKMELNTGYIDGKILVTLEKISLGSLDIPKFLVDKGAEKFIEGNEELSESVNQYGEVVIKNTNYDDKLSYTFKINEFLEDKFKIANILNIEDILVSDDGVMVTLSIQTNLQDLLEYITIGRE